MAHETDRSRRTFDAVPSSARAARQYVSEVLREHGASASVIDDCSLVVSELVTNAIEHSGGSLVEVSLHLGDPEWLVLEVVGGAPAGTKRVSPPETWRVAGSDEVSGRGLGIVRQLMHDVVIDAAHDRVIVRCRQRRSPVR